MRNNIIAFSGGKDSTALLLMMLERGENVHSVMFFDTGWEFPQMYDHIAKVEEYTGIEIVRLKPEKSFDYWMFDAPIKKQKGPDKGKIHRIGNDWPNPHRWCTRIKIRTQIAYAKTIEDSVECIGFAADEEHRTESKEFKRRSVRFPLVEWGISEEEALAYCRERGFHWDGLYNIFFRVSCYLCPHKRVEEIRNVRKHFPDLWEKMLDMDRRQKHWFKDEKSLRWWDERFEYEESMMEHIA